MGLVASAAVVLALVAWGVAVAVSLERRKHYRDNTLDEGFSADERLRGELTTLHVALLRAGVASYYEKVFEMLRRILKIRRLILDDDTTTGAILERLRSAEVDPTFLDCVESVANRCDAVLTGGAHPDEAAHGKIARDLKMLFTMRPNLAGRPRGRKSGDSDEA